MQLQTCIMAATHAPYYIHSRNGSAIYRHDITGELELEILNNKDKDDDDDITTLKRRDEYTYIGAINKFKLILCNSPITYATLELIKFHRIKIIEFYCTFNYDINNLPDFIEYIDIQCAHYNQPITKLPNNLKIFKLGAVKYEYPITCWPETISKIYLSGKCDILLQNLPPLLQVLDLFNLDLSSELWYLPISLKELYFKSSVMTLCATLNMIKYQLPPNLEKLFISAFEISWIYDSYIQDIAKNLKIYVGKYGNKIYGYGHRAKFATAATTSDDYTFVDKHNNSFRLDESIEEILKKYTTRIVRYNQEDMFIEI